MNTYYIPIHFYEQEPENDELVMFITKHEITDVKLQNYFEQKKESYMERNKEDFDQDAMVDEIFNELGEITRGFWCYCKMMPRLVIGDND